MFECDNCKREFKSKAGLSKHVKSCNKEELVEEVDSNDVCKNKECSYNTLRKIEKLVSARKSTWDAEARHKIDLQIEELKNT